jgi:peptidoglycan/xylan/chitin deacetylase (PgdA/CDA1 family)
MYLIRPPYLLKKLFPSAIWRMDANQNKIYLTFDDGPVPEVTNWVLDVLKEHNIKATFFCVGENAQKHPDLFQRIIDEKHIVGNHTYHHLNGWKTHTKNYLENVELFNQTITSGRLKSNVVKFFRPPYGRIKKSQILNLKSDYSIIMWDVLSGDFDTTISPEQCLLNVTSHTRNGSIIVFHDSYKAKNNLTYALPRFIEFAKIKGFEFATL